MMEDLMLPVVVDRYLNSSGQDMDIITCIARGTIVLYLILPTPMNHVLQV